jgi:hypothetical protein
VIVVLPHGYDTESCVAYGLLAFHGVGVQLAIGGTSVWVYIGRFVHMWITMPVIAVEFIDGVGRLAISIDLETPTLGANCILPAILCMLNMYPIPLGHIIQPLNGLLGVAHWLLTFLGWSFDRLLLGMMWYRYA